MLDKGTNESNSQSSHEGTSATNTATPTVVTVLSTLSGKHLAELHASGLDDETIRECGYYTEPYSAAIVKMLGWKEGYDGKHGPALTIPFYDTKGERIKDYTRLKFDIPRVKKNKKETHVIKYESPLGKTNRAYFPPGQAADLMDVTCPAILVEGEKKTAAGRRWLKSRRVAAIGLVGVYGWMKKRPKDADGKPIGVRELIPDLVQIPWAGRTVYIIFDSDARHNKQVRLAISSLSEVLTGHGAIVKAVWLPDGPPNADGTPKKQGLDDFLVAHSVDELAKLMDEAEEPKPLQPGSFPKEAIDDPDRLSRVVIKREFTHGSGVVAIRKWREDYYISDEKVYHRRPEDEIKSIIHRAVKDELDERNCEIQAMWTGEGEPPTAIKVTQALKNNVLGAIESKVILSESIERSTWIGPPLTTSKNIIVMRNGLLDIDALLQHKADFLFPHTPNFFTTSLLDFDFDPKAECPLWLACIKRTLEDDRERIAIMQEWFGLNLIYNMEFQKFLVMEGEGQNGKSVICAVLKAIVGEDNCSAVPLELFAERFQLTSSVGKLANIVPECGELDKTAEGFLKAFVSGDTMLFDRKNKTPLECPATARLTLAFNNRPRFNDRSQGLWRRMILMPMRVVITEDERVPGMDKVEWWKASGELPGIFAWAIVGLARLMTQQQFTKSSICADAVSGYQLESNPARTFLQEKCKEDATANVITDSLYRHYREWAIHNGHSPMASPKFGAEVKRQFPKAQRRQGQQAIGDGKFKRAWAYYGVRSEVGESCEFET